MQNHGIPAAIRGHQVTICAPLLLATMFTGLLGVAAQPASAATQTVTNCADSGTGSLRAAVAAASAGDTVSFSPSLGCNLITLTSGDVAISKNLTVDGPGASALAISGNNTSTVFDIDTDTTVTISALTIENGYANGSFSYDSAGGGINDLGTLNVTNDALSNNSAPGGGGGIANLGNGSLTVTNSNLTGNSASSDGGGIANFGNGSLTVMDSNLTGNRSTGDDGGGIASPDGQVTVTDSTVSGNSAFSGGGGIICCNDGGSLTNSTVSNNTAGIGGGGLYVAGGSSTITVANSTIASNVAVGNGVNHLDDGHGGGFFVDSGTVNIANSTLSGNSASVAGGGVWIEPPRLPAPQLSKLRLLLTAHHQAVIAQVW